MAEFNTKNIPLDDRRAMELGNALMGNSALDELELTLTDRTTLLQQGKSFTARGAGAMLFGIAGSQMKFLSISGSETPPLEIAQLGSQSVEYLTLHFPMRDELFATQLCESLLTKTRVLQTVAIQVNEMTPRVAHIFSTFFQRSPTITSLRFEDRSTYGATITTTPPTTTRTSIVAMQTLYSEGVQHYQNIQSLCLNRVVGDMHALVTTLPNLRELTIEKVELSLAEIELLTHAVRDAGQLHKLTLSDCKLSHAHMNVLSPILGSHQSIKRVDLCHNKIGDAGIIMFVDHWRPESATEELLLCNNNVGSEGAERLITASSNRSTLGLLNLGFNKSIGYNGLLLIAEVLPNAKIQNLALWNVCNWTEYADVTCDEAVIQDAKCMAVGKALLEGARNNRHLLKLILLDLHMPSIVTEEIDLYMKANALGRRAVFEQSHSLPHGVWCYFLSKEGMTCSLLFLFLRELPGVVMGGSGSTIGRKRCRV